LVTKRDRYDCIICGCRRGKSRDSVQYGDRVRGGVDDDYLLLPSRHSCRGWLSVTELSDKSQRCQAQLEHLALVVDTLCQAHQPGFPEHLRES
jgi:hypothetical protein